MIRAVLFDAVDTLIELREPVGETYSRLAREHGVAISAWRLNDAFHRVLPKTPPPAQPDPAPDAVERREREWWRSLVRATFRAADSAKRFEDFDAFFDRLFRHYAGASSWRERPGASALLDRLRAEGRRLAVVSNFDRRLPAILDGLGLGERLDAVVLPTDAGAAKPDPRIFGHALAALGVTAGEALFVGNDAGLDLRAARAAGMAAVDARALATLEDLRIPGEGEA